MRIITIFVLALVLSVNLQAKKKGAPPMASGAPGDRTCNTSKCHATNDLNTDKAKIIIEGLVLLGMLYLGWKAIECSLRCPRRIKKLGFFDQSHYYFASL